MNRELARENWDAWSPEFMEIWYSGNYFAPISTLEPLNSSFTLKFVRSSTWGNMTTGTMTIMNSNKIPVSRCCPNMCFETSRQFRKYALARVQPEGRSERFTNSFFRNRSLFFFSFFLSFPFFPFFCPLPDDPMRASVFRNWELICVARTFFPRWRKEKNTPALLSQMMCGLRDKGQKLFWDG